MYCIVVMMEASYLKRHQSLRDALNFVIFIALVLIGTLLINNFVFRSFNVVGPSMEPTFYTGDRLIVNRLPVTWSNLKGESYVPDRGEIIVFKNPRYISGQEEKFIVKRVIAFPGERVTIEEGILKVYNDDNPENEQFPSPTRHFLGHPSAAPQRSSNGQRRSRLCCRLP